MFCLKASWIKKSEKPTNYFFLIGRIISDLKQINHEIESFYSDLLETKSSAFFPQISERTFSALLRT